MSEVLVRAGHLSVNCPVTWKTTSNPRTSTCTQQADVLDGQATGFARADLGVANVTGSIVKGLKPPVSQSEDMQAS